MAALLSCCFQRLQVGPMTNMPPMETFGGKSIVDLKRGIGDTEAASRKKPKLEKEEEKKGSLVKKCEFEMELDEKVDTGSGAKLEPSGNVFCSFKVEEVSQTLPLHTGAR